MNKKTKENVQTGGGFIISETGYNNIFIPEDFTEEHKMVAEMCHQFIDNEVLPNLNDLDAQKEGLMESLLNKAAELGLLGLDIPEEYDGFGKDLLTSMLTTEILGAGHSFPVAWAAHTGIGILPILYFGNDKQKKKYLPKMAKGEWIGAYCLTEPDSGSDALAAKTKAVLSKDKKHYVLNGQKMWITNAGFAHVFIVFAKINGEDFSAFIVERDAEGISFGEEEHKMGIKGSSTRQVFFSDCKIPAENLLGEQGKGHKIAFNILNIGRLKLASATMGASKKAIQHSVSYASERKQFGKKISEFGAIKHKLAMQLIKTFAVESCVYRVTNEIQRYMNQLIEEGKDDIEAKLSGTEEYAIECAILKVLGSEVLDYVVDESVQIFGGYGFSAEYPVERAYRDSRINRIFEGTNEINRLLTIDMVFKRALKGRLDILSHAKAIQNELMSVPTFGDGEDALLEKEKTLIKNLKKTALMTSGMAAQKYMQRLADEQEVVMCLADILICIYAVESVMLRVEKMIAQDNKDKDILLNILRAYLSEQIDLVNRHANTVIMAISEGDERKMLLMGLKRYTKPLDFNTIQSKRIIADFLIEKGKYSFGILK